MSTSPSSDDASAIKALGWRQGSVPSPTLVPDQFPGALSESDPDRLLIVASHDCDVTNSHFSREPCVELIIARSVEGLDGNCTGGKNSRRLHLTIEFPDGAHAFSVESSERLSIDRRVLLDSPPSADRVLRPPDRRFLGSWLAKRYDRAAFPDAFNERVKPSHRRIRECLRKGAMDITAIFLAVGEEEFGPAEPYEVVFRAVIVADDYADAKRRLAAQRCVDELAGLLTRCEGIELVDHALVSDDEITLADMKLMKRWDFDWLSLDDD